MEAQPMETDSGVESAETLPSGAEIITTKTEMETESWKRLFGDQTFLPFLSISLFRIQRKKNVQSRK